MPLPTGAELDILAVLWRLGAATVREVHDELGKDSGYTTTLKQMQLMTEKGLLLAQRTLPVARLRSRHSQGANPAADRRRPVEARLDGSAGSLLMGALSAQPASREELAEIRRMLDTFVKEKGRSR